MLNEKLVEKQGLTKAGVARVKLLHGEREVLFKRMESLSPETDYGELRECVTELTDLEFRLQEAWGFELNSDFHSWWFRAPHCQCPVLDNFDAVGVKYNYINADCPLHGN